MYRIIGRCLMDGVEMEVQNTFKDENAAIRAGRKAASGCESMRLEVLLDVDDEIKWHIIKWFK